jgi:putative nucleotidyltransferase with HDIG domain
VSIFSYIRAKHNLVFKLFVVALFSYLLSIMLPDTEVKGHKLDSFTTVWPYSDLITDQDFYLEKTPSELKKEKDDIRRDAPLFFEQNNQEKDERMKKLEDMKAYNAPGYHRLKPLLDSVYRRGVIESVPEAGPGKLIFVTYGNYAENALYDDFFTIQSAADYLENRLASSVPSGASTLRFADFLAINFFFSRQKSSLYVNSKLDQISLYKNVIRAGDVLVRQGETLNEAKRQLLNRYFEFNNKSAGFSFVRSLAKWGLTFILCMVLLVFLAFFRKSIFGQNTQVIFLFLMMLGAVFATSMFQKYDLMVLSLPFALVPILVRVFFDGRTALFTHLLIVLQCSFFLPDKLQFILLELVTGIGTLFVVAEMRKRQQILNAAAIIFIFYLFIFISYQLAFGTPESIRKVISYIPFAISSMLVLLAYPLIYLTEKFFGFISDFKLLELCDLNHPLLRKLSKEVPGTFQHSLQVANLAEEAIYYIGGNSLLVRAGSMYHDIGKIENPFFFTENQPKGFSPHQEIEPVESARIIINHVIAGVEMAKKYKLPEQIIDFIRTHHGTTSVRYFLNLFKKQGSAESRLAESQFRYPGPIPFSKETAVLMIADGVEAASRSLKTHDAVTISDLVDNIIDYKIANNQFINSDITFKDITTIKKIFKKRLMNIYHARIEYPE